MNPQACIEKQLERYRQMTCGERIGIALRLHEMASEMARAGIRAQQPNAAPQEIENLLRARRRLAYVR